MAHAHLKPILGSINRLHAGAEAWPMALPCAQHQIDPGMDHLVAQRAFRGLLGQGFQQRPGQHNFTAPAGPDARATTIKTGGAAHPAVTPTHATQRLAIEGQGAIEMLPVEAMKNRQQRQQRHDRVGCSDAASSCRGQSDSSLL